MIYQATSKFPCRTRAITAHGAPGGSARAGTFVRAPAHARPGPWAASGARCATQWDNVSQPRTKIAIIGGGPGGYEAALVAAQLGAEVTVVERDGLGGACVLTDCVPSKTLIATSGMMAGLDGSAGLGIRINSDGNVAVHLD